MLQDPSADAHKAGVGKATMAPEQETLLCQPPAVFVDKLERDPRRAVNEDIVSKLTCDEISAGLVGPLQDGQSLDHVHALFILS